jgi:FkbM family methyltransferase
LKQPGRPTKLPDGRTVRSLQPRGVGLVWREVESYFESGVHLRPGATVLDVGANIGLFSICVVDRLGSEVRILAFEPVDQTRMVLQGNIAAHTASGVVEVFDCGLGQDAGEVVCSHYPRAPVLSTAYPDEAGDRKEIREAGFSGHGGPAAHVDGIGDLHGDRASVRN